ncbi:MAG: hypothetical protein ACXVBY_18775 [Isosphaeraceae bacterium]
MRNPPFADLCRRETLTDTLHIIGATVDVLFILLIIGFGATAFGKRFRLYSIGTILVLVVFGALAGLDGPRVAGNLPTPWAGVTERINICGFLLWVVVLAIALLRGRRDVASPRERRPPVEHCGHSNAGGFGGPSVRASALIRVSPHSSLSGV